MIVSRKIPGSIISTQVKLDLDNDERITSDIERFISIKVKQLPAIQRLDDKFRTTIQNTFLERAEGTFLWVGFVMNELY